MHCRRNPGWRGGWQRQNWSRLLVMWIVLGILVIPLVLFLLRPMIAFLKILWIIVLVIAVIAIIQSL